MSFHSTLRGAASVRALALAAGVAASFGLAPLVVKEIFEVMRDINRTQKVTILLVEQNAHMALSIADRGYVLVKGKVAQEGDAKELLSSKAATKTDF